MIQARSATALSSIAVRVRKYRAQFSSNFVPPTRYALRLLSGPGSHAAQRFRISAAIKSAVQALHKFKALIFRLSKLICNTDAFDIVHQCKIKNRSRIVSRGSYLHPRIQTQLGSLLNLLHQVWRSSLIAGQAFLDICCPERSTDGICKGEDQRSNRHEFQ